MAFQAKKQNLQGILVADAEKYFEKGLTGSTVAKIAVEGGEDQDLGVRRYSCVMQFGLQIDIS